MSSSNSLKKRKKERLRLFLKNLAENTKCDAECGDRANIRGNPWSTKLMLRVWKNQGNKLTRQERKDIKSGKIGIREFFCEKLKQDPKFCAQMKKTIPGSKVRLLRQLRKTRAIPISLPFNVYQDRVLSTFRGLRWAVPTVENHCVQLQKELTQKENEKTSRELKFSKSQEFLSRFFVPRNDTKGILMYHSVGSGKCHKIDTPILMYDGTVKKVQDITVNELVMGDDSTPRTVIDLARGKSQMYKVIPVKGEPFSVNEDHILCLKNRERIIEISVKDYINLDESNKSNLRLYKNLVEFSEKELPIEAYHLGYWLVDTSRRQNYLLPNNIINKYNFVENPYIPYEYKCNSRENRLKFLAGMLDARGGLNEKGFYLIVKRERLIDDIIFLCRSLGFNCYKEKYEPKVNGKIALFGRYRIIINGNGIEDIPIKTSVELDTLSEKGCLESEFTIKPEGIDNYYGFSVDKNHRYLMGDFTVTHNSCSSILTASSEYIAEGWNILWVTRSTLKPAYYKNIFDDVCHFQMLRRLQSGKEIPKDQESRRKLLSKQWLPPVSYKTFSNAMKGKIVNGKPKGTELYKRLVRLNGNDPLRKTLVIIDEAHNLVAGSGLKPQEEPNTKNIVKALYNSYNKSGKDSVNVMLLTATPIVNSVMDVVLLLNLLIPKNENRFPFDLTNFKKGYLKSDGTFSEDGIKKFQEKAKGLISVLDRTDDPRQFAQVKLTKIYSDMSYEPSGDFEARLKECSNAFDNQFEKCKKISTKIGRDTCKERAKRTRNKCKEVIKKEKAKRKESVNQFDQMVTNCKINLK